MQHTVCEGLLETPQDMISRLAGQTRRADKPRFVLRDKSDGNRKLQLANPVTRPTTANCVGNKTTRKVNAVTSRKKEVTAAGRNTSRSSTKTTVASSTTIGKRLLADIIAIFKAKDMSKMRSKQLLTHLCADSKKPWATFCGGKKLHCHRLSALLKEFGIRSKDMRFSNNRSFKGYQLEWFVDAKRCCRNSSKASTAKK